MIKTGVYITKRCPWWWTFYAAEKHFLLRVMKSQMSLYTTLIFYWNRHHQCLRLYICTKQVSSWWHFPRFWPFVRRIHCSPVNSPRKSQWRGALMFSLFCAWIHNWVNNREAGDFRCHHAHYDVTEMWKYNSVKQRHEHFIVSKYSKLWWILIYGDCSFLFPVTMFTNSRFLAKLLTDKSRDQSVTILGNTIWKYKQMWMYSKRM